MINSLSYKKICYKNKKKPKQNPNQSKRDLFFFLAPTK